MVFDAEAWLLEANRRYDAKLRETIQVLESSDNILKEHANDLDIQFDYNGSVLTPGQRWTLIQKCLPELGFNPFNMGIYSKAEEPSKEANEPSEEEILVEQANALGEQFDYDGSVLTPEQRRAVFLKMFAFHLKDNGLRSPQYYAEKSQCLSVAETAWPGVVGYLKADRLKRGYIEPEELIERLSKLKPSDNFELRKFRHPRMKWKSPTPLQEKGIEIGPGWPSWVMDQLYAVTDAEKRLGRKSAARDHQEIRNWAVQLRQEIKDRWAVFESGVELAPFPDSHLLKDMGRSPGGTLFPWYLVKGLMALRHHANEMGSKSYDEEYDSAEAKREEAINRWRERNLDSILEDDPVSIYRTWPADLMAELDEITREAIRCGRRKYVAFLREAEEKMQTLVAFWTDCGLVTGQRTTPSCWWQDPKAKAEQLPKPQYLQERLSAINTEFGYHSDKAEKLRMIETSYWMESIISGNSEPTASDTPLPHALLDELDNVWRDRNWLDGDDTEDEMIARIRRWRESKQQQCVEEGLRTSPQLVSDSGPVMTPEETRQLQEKRSRRTRRQPRMNQTAEGRGIWGGRLRVRPDAVGASRDRTKATKTLSEKPQGIIKLGKASKKRRPAATKGQATNSTTQKAGTSHLSSQSHLNESSPQTIPTSITKARRTGLRRRPCQARAAQPLGVQKTRNDNRRQSHGPMRAVLTTNRKQGLLRLLTPPQSK